MLKKTLLIIIFQFFFVNDFIVANQYKYDVAVCAIFQNEASYLKEWIEFHRLAGVQHFYLFNNSSRDNFLAVLRPYIKSGLVELHNWPFKSNEISEWNEIQCSAYNYGIKLSKNKTKWLAVLDVDEFLFPVKCNSLADFLVDYEEHGAVAVNWQMYGTSWVTKVPQGEPIIEYLLYKAPKDHSENRHIKVIVRPEHVDHFGNPHFCYFKDKKKAVDSNMEIVPDAFSSNILIDKIRINHYWTRDEEYFFGVKVTRRRNWHDVTPNQRANLLNAEEDSVILKYLPQLKDKLR